MATEINEMAQACLERAKGDWHSAARRMKRAVNADEKLKRLLLEPLIDVAIWEAVRLAGRQTRSKIMRGASPDNTNGLELMASATRDRCLLDFTLRNGLKLRDAHRPDVIEAADHYAVNSITMGIRGRWLHAIVRRLPDDQKSVGDVCTEEAACKLYDAAESSE